MRRMRMGEAIGFPLMTRASLNVLNDSSLERDSAREAAADAGASAIHNLPMRKELHRMLALGLRRNL